ncbi:alpha/beta fold hydrolase [Parablautia sp. Marseille-Q6255]|uniref:alpha/beta fold hydrolase n=1 Tax=Parablautia sp. Marseille-Q6255 TaxID=3039593 RepID=UPI0024BD2B21|nr:alpha/beta hydrolase [Parablautia sp. Marseille-Q6255]
MSKIELNDGKHIYYEEYGEGNKYVICTMIDYPRYSSIKELCKLGFHVFLLTNRGFGKSDHSEIDYGSEWWDIWAKDVISFADKKKINKFVYAGDSHGAGTGWHICKDYQDRLIAFVAIVPGPYNLDEGFVSYRTRILRGEYVKPMDTPPEYFDDAAVIERVRQDKEYMAIEQQDHQSPEEKKLDYKRPLMGLKNEKNTKDFLRSIYVPTLVIGGTEDPISRPDLMLRTVECIPHSKLILYHGFSHNEPWKIFVEEVSSEIAFFLDNVYNNEGHYYKKIENL